MVPSPFPEWEDATWERMPIGFDSRSLTVKWMAPFYRYAALAVCVCWLHLAAV